MRLTPREREVASVAADLLMKGNPSTRIAKYCLRKKMDLSQVYKLLKKLPVMDPNRDILRVFHRLDEMPECLDQSQEHGKVLRETLDSHGK